MIDVYIRYTEIAVAGLCANGISFEIWNIIKNQQFCPTENAMLSCFGRFVFYYRSYENKNQNSKLLNKFLEN